jgi:hypothetical protein
LLVVFALRTALHASRELVSFGLITQSSGDQPLTLYRLCGFQDLLFGLRGAMIVAHGRP